MSESIAPWVKGRGTARQGNSASRLFPWAFLLYITAFWIGRVEFAYRCLIRLVDPWPCVHFFVEHAGLALRRCGHPHLNGAAQSLAWRLFVLAWSLFVLAGSFSVLDALRE